MDKKSTVGIVKVMDGDVGKAMESLVSLLGGLDSVISLSDTVLVKPNLATDKSYLSGAVTHPEVIRKCADMAVKAGTRKVIVGDSAIIGKDTNAVIEKNGLASMISKRVEVKDFKASEMVTVAVPNATRYRRLPFPKEVMECDVIINLPVMKTHDCLPVTLGLKNMKGLVPDKVKRRIHKLGVEEAIIDINRVALADITIIDGVIGMEGDGPLDGDAANMGVIIGSFDALAAEVIAIKAMGFDPGSMSYIQMAYKAGFGEMNPDRIHIVGENLQDIKKNFKSNYFQKKEIGDKRMVIEDAEACSACRNVINMFLKEDVLHMQTDKLKDVCLAAGSYKDGTSPAGCKLLGVGNCLANCKDRFDEFVPGCPPLKRNISSAYRKLIEL